MRVAVGYTLAGIGIAVGAILITIFYYIPAAIIAARYKIKDARS